MRIVKVKICGITTLEDAHLAIDLGADILGFNFFGGSPRYLPCEQAARIAVQLPAFVSLAGVFVNAEAPTIRDTARQCHLEWIQLHGDETPEFCEQFHGDSLRVIKALRVKNVQDVTRAESYRDTDAVLLDAFSSGQYGGTGQTFDWGLLGHTNHRIFLAGGIGPHNVQAAADTGVFGIDVCSGVESSPGRKDPDKMRALFEGLRQVRR